MMRDYTKIVVGTDGSSLAEPTVARAAWLAAHDNAQLIVVCAFSELSRRAEAKNVASLGGDSRVGQVLGRQAASEAIAGATSVAHSSGATDVTSRLIDGDPAKALLEAASEAGAELIVVGARHDVSIADRLLGTVATEVVRRATCEVLVVRPLLEEGDLVVGEDA